MVDIDDLLRPALEESDRAGRRVGVELDPAARFERTRSRDSLDRAVPIEATGARQGIAHDGLLGRELGVICEVLEVTAAAAPIPGAGRLDPIFARVQD